MSTYMHIHVVTTARDIQPLQRGGQRYVVNPGSLDVVQVQLRHRSVAAGRDQVVHVTETLRHRVQPVNLRR